MLSSPDIHVNLGGFVLVWMSFPSHKVAGITRLAIVRISRNISMFFIHSVFFVGMTIQAGKISIDGRDMAFNTV